MYHSNLNENLEEKLNRPSIKLQPALLNKSWKKHPIKKAVICPVTSNLTNHLVRYCYRKKFKLVSDVLRWTNSHGHTSVGRQAKKLHASDLCRHWMPRRGTVKNDEG